VFVRLSVCGQDDGLISDLHMGGATVLKVGDNFASGASQKIFFDPHFLASGGGQNIA